MSKAYTRPSLRGQGSLVRSQFRKLQSRPLHRRGNHNHQDPPDLRLFPVCYLCGGQWKLYRPIRSRGELNRVTTWHEWQVTVQCERCLVVVDAYADVGVVHSREWLTHDRIAECCKGEQGWGGRQS
jgi:putative SOS response-associated peptidase YedK